MAAMALSLISPWPQESFGAFSLGKSPMQIQSYDHQQQSKFISNTQLCYPPPCSQLHVQPYLKPNPNHQVAQQF